MKIVYFIEDITESGGVERIITQKASALTDDYGHDVTIVAAYEIDKSIRFPLSSGVKVVSLGIKRARHGSVFATALDRISIFFLTILRFNRIVKAMQPDTIFYVWVLGAMLLPFTRTKAARIFESHSSRRNTPYKPFLWLMEHCTDSVVCLTSGDADEYRHARVKHVIPNFVDIPQQTMLPDYTVRRAIAIGRLVEAKGFDRLVRMWGQVLKQHPDWQLDIYGIGHLHDSLRTQIENAHLAHSIHLCGHTDDIHAACQQHSLHLMTSHAEGQPMVLIEAQSCGLPSLTFDFDYGARDVITSGASGIIVPQDDEQAFVQALCQLMQSADQRAAMGLKARANVQRFSREHIMPLWDIQIAKRFNTKRLPIQ